MNIYFLDSNALYKFKNIEFQLNVLNKLHNMIILKSLPNECPPCGIIFINFK